MAMDTVDMKTNNPSGFHYFVHDGMNRSEKIQAKVIEMLLSSKLPQEDRESSVQWELKHSSSVIQFAKLLAQKRGVDEELAAVAAALHDIYVIIHGNYKDHGRLGGPVARALLEETGQFSEHEMAEVEKAVAAHSDKHVYSDGALAELIKDADLLDAFFYGDEIYEYKPEAMRGHYYRRIVSVREELGLPKKQYFSQRLAGRSVS